MKKGQAFALVHFTLFVMSLGAFWSGSFQELWPGLVAGMVANAATFIGGNVADNGVRGRFYQPELNRGE
jgi:hypothetical protein